MVTTWFCLVAVMLAIYVLLDGFDLGAGAIDLLVARTPEERRQGIASIGPLWDGNEVWLLAAGGTLYRVSRTLRQRLLQSPVWIPLWGFVFCISQLVAVRISWRGARQRRSWRASGCQRLFL
jgi:cytochrome bd-type quinol oxidase subunit 2